tara:strand:+ start:47 stop:505 length:459 start_codon:yes stop_codon:yes gene_type:complete
MKKILLILIFSFFFTNSGFALTKGKGEVIMSDRVLDHFTHYVWGNFDVDKNKVKVWASRKNNPKSLLFIMSSDGEWSMAYFCPYSACTTTGAEETIRDCERKTGVNCGVFALRKRIYWDNGINTSKNKAKINRNMDAERIKSLMISLGFYEE